MRLARLSILVIPMLLAACGAPTDPTGEVDGPVVVQLSGTESFRTDYLEK